jgi:hypothetical protein
MCVAHDAPMRWTTGQSGERYVVSAARDRLSGDRQQRESGRAPC